MRISFVSPEWNRLSTSQQWVLKQLYGAPVPMEFKHPKIQSAKALVRRGYAERVDQFPEDDPRRRTETGYRITAAGEDLIKQEEKNQAGARRFMDALRGGMKERGELG